MALIYCPHCKRPVVSISVAAVLNGEVAIPSSPLPTLETPVNEIGWSTRVCNFFTEAKITTLGDLVRYTEAALLREPNVGKTSVAEIKETLRQFGVNLGMELEKN